MPPSIPIATYRLQLTPSFGFDRAAALVPYLKALGVSHLYASPFLQARAGSSHGYDIVDHNAFNPELGGEQGFRRLREALDRAGHRPHSRLRPQSHGRALCGQCLVARRARMGAAVALCRLFRHRLGNVARPASRGGVLLPILGSRMARRWRAATSSCATIAAKGASPPGITSTGCRSAPALWRDPAEGGDRGRRAEQPAGRRLLALAARYRGPHNPPRSKRRC